MLGIGVDPQLLNSFNFELSIKRITKDIQSDFIYAPHYNSVFYKCPDDIIQSVTSLLNNKRYTPKNPITIEVVKSSGLSRPGSILNPIDRLIYQSTVDFIACDAVSIVDPNIVFSNRLLSDDENGFMFESAGDSYSSFRNKITSECEDNLTQVVIKADVASYFERIYQHNLCNLLRSANCDARAVNLLEKILSLFTQKDSHGIIQGVFPSDFLGNLYLSSIDTQLQLKGIKSYRYVDDMYLFFNDTQVAQKILVLLNSILRKEGLNLNESKTDILNSSELIREETSLDKMFNKAKQEISGYFDRDDFYSSNISWDEEYYDDELDDQELDLLATKSLFNLEGLEDEVRFKVDRFCLNIFDVANDDYGIDYVLSNYQFYPHLSQVYAKYLKKIVSLNAGIVIKIEKIILSNALIFETQYMWLYASLVEANRVSSRVIVKAMSQLTDRNIDDTLRAVCAIIIGKFGNATQRRALKAHYSHENSEYVKSAILYIARYFPANERSACFTAWSGHNDLFPLIVKASKAML